MKNGILKLLLVCYGVSNGDVGTARVNIFQEIRLGALVQKRRLSLEIMGEGTTVERL